MLAVAQVSVYTSAASPFSITDKYNDVLIMMLF